MRRPARLFGVLLALAVITGAVLAAAASGGQAFHETVHVEETFDVEDFCGVEGMTVEITQVVDVRLHVVPHGSDRLAYFLQHVSLNEVLTFDGRSLTSVANVTAKDLRVTDNSDGTLTILILATGNRVLYDANGEAIARNPGQVRFEIVVDHGGTPNDPSDDTELDFRIVKESTGRSDDFCDAAVPALS